MTDGLNITISPQVVTVEIADPNTVLTAADAVATADDRVQTGLDRLQTGLDRIQAAADATTATNQAAAAAASAASFRVNSATYAAIPTLTASCFVFVAVDETNDNQPTVYFFDGTNLNWLPSVGV